MHRTTDKRSGALQRLLYQLTLACRYGDTVGAGTLPTVFGTRLALGLWRHRLIVSKVSGRNHGTGTLLFNGRPRDHSSNVCVPVVPRCPMCRHYKRLEILGDQLFRRPLCPTYTIPLAVYGTVSATPPADNANQDASVLAVRRHPVDGRAPIARRGCQKKQLPAAFQNLPVHFLENSSGIY